MIRILAFAFTLLILSVCVAGTVGDVDGDGTVGLPEAINALQIVSNTKATVTTVSSINVVSSYVEAGGTNMETVIMTVPADKSFVLTDLICTSANGVEFYLLEDDRIKLYAIPDITNPPRKRDEFHFNTGMPFGAGSRVVIKTATGTGQFSISGYEVDN